MRSFIKLSENEETRPCTPIDLGLAAQSDNTWIRFFKICSALYKTFWKRSVVVCGMHCCVYDFQDIFFSSIFYRWKTQQHETKVTLENPIGGGGVEEETHIHRPQHENIRYKSRRSAVSQDTLNLSFLILTRTVSCRYTSSDLSPQVGVFTPARTRAALHAPVVAHLLVRGFSGGRLAIHNPTRSLPEAQAGLKAAPHLCRSPPDVCSSLCFLYTVSVCPSLGSLGSAGTDQLAILLKGRGGAFNHTEIRQTCAKKTQSKPTCKANHIKGSIHNKQISALSCVTHAVDWRAWWLINTLSQSHHWSHRSETAQPISEAWHFAQQTEGCLLRSSCCRMEQRVVMWTHSTTGLQPES